MNSSEIRLLVAAIAIACAALPAASARATTPPNLTKIASNGFGDQRNGYAWSMAWFKGKLYVGTGRSQHCVEAATLDFYYPNQGQYNPQPAPDLSCPPNKYDLDLRAEIWQYTPSTGAWVRVYRSSADVPNPRAAGKFVARDIGFRGMVVHNDALYVGGVTAGEYIPELAQSHPPRILRTGDGASFTPLNGAPAIINTASGPQRPIGYRAMEVHDGRMFVTASGGLLGDGVIVEIGNPDGAAPTFTQVSPAGMQVFEMESFNGSLYAGTGDSRSGYSVFRTSATGTLPYTFGPIVTGGAGRGALTTSVVAMHPYRGRLYIGASGWFGTLAQSELIRVNTNDTWDLVVGNPRLDWNLQLKYPISNLIDGFGNPFNAHFWRGQEHQGELQVGTNDWSWSLRQLPLVPQLLGIQFGFDVFGSCDGASWYGVTASAFGDGLYNFGARTMSSTSEGRFYGSTNHATGTSVWRQTGASACPALTASASSSRASSATARASEPAPLQPPRKLRTARGRCAAALTWTPSARARRYSILRSEYRPVAAVRAVAPKALPNGLRFDSVPRARIGAAASKIMAPSEPVLIARTAKTGYADRRARRTRRYLYQVVARNGSRRSMATLAEDRPRGPRRPATRRAARLLRAACR